MKLTQRIKQNRHRRIRAQSTALRPRLSVFAHQHIYAQVIDDTQHHTLVAASTPGLKSLAGLFVDTGSDCSKRYIKGVFDRGGNLYHGRVALAEAARSWVRFLRVRGQ